MAQKSKLFVGGLGQNATEDNLYQTFDKFGKIDDACIVYDKETGNSRGFGYVTFAETNDAEAAMKALRGMTIDGKEINVEYANAKDPAKEAAKRMNRYGGPGGGGGGGGGGRGGGWPPRGRGGPPRGRGGPPGRGMRGRGPPDRRGPPPSRGYDNYGGGYDDQYASQRYEREYPPARDGYGYGAPARQRDSHDSYQQRPAREGPPPARDGGGYDRYPQAERERYPQSERGRPAHTGGPDRYNAPERNNYGSDNYNSQPVDRYGGPPPTASQRTYGRDW